MRSHYFSTRPQRCHSNKSRPSFPLSLDSPAACRTILNFTFLLSPFGISGHRPFVFLGTKLVLNGYITSDSDWRHLISLPAGEAEW